MQKILTIPDPILNTPSVAVNEFTQHTYKTIEQLTQTMRENKGCVGIAAPQIGELIRIVVVDVSLYRKIVPNRGLTVLVNPKITKSEGRCFGREGCLSVPELTGNVWRAKNIEVEARDENNNKICFKSEGFESVVFQHEIDHLDGLLFLDRVASIKTDIFRRKDIVKDINT